MVRISERRPPTPTLALFGISALSLGLQAIIIFVPSQGLWGPDGDTYVGIAERMRWPLDVVGPDLGDENYWAIGYPLFLRFLDVFPWSGLLFVTLVQSGLLIGTALAAYKIASPLREPFRVATFALVALSPSLLFASRVIGYESLLAFLLTTALFLLLRVQRQSSKALVSLVLAGVCLGIATWVQSKVLVLAPVFILTMFVGRPFVNGLVRAMWFLAGFLVPLLLLAGRNALVHDRFSPVTDNAAINAWIGNSPESSGRYMAVYFPPDWRETLLERIGAFALDSPRDFVTLQVRKVVELFVPTRERPDFGFAVLDLSIEALQFAWLLCLALGLGLYISGLAFRVLGRATELWPVALTCLVGLLTHVPFIADARMRLPYEPMLIVLSVAVASVTLARWRDSRSDEDCPGVDCRTSASGSSHSAVHVKKTSSDVSSP